MHSIVVVVVVLTNEDVVFTKNIPSITHQILTEPSKKYIGAEAAKRFL